MTTTRLGARGFSLLEMMVAIALLSMGLVILLQVQARSIQLAQSAREMTVATMLARGKILDCENDLLKKGFSVGDYDLDGNFEDEGYPTFYWECHGYQPNMPDVDSAGGADLTGALDQAGAGNTADALSQQPGGGGDIGMQFLAPILSQMSSILGNSIRELVVIVRWGEADDLHEMTVTKHVIDKGPVNQVAGMIAAQAGALQSLTGGGANGTAAGKDATTTGKSPSSSGSSSLKPVGAH